MRERTSLKQINPLSLKSRNQPVVEDRAEMASLQCSHVARHLTSRILRLEHLPRLRFFSHRRRRIWSEHPGDGAGAGVIRGGGGGEVSLLRDVALSGHAMFPAVLGPAEHVSIPMLPRAKQLPFSRTAPAWTVSRCRNDLAMM